MPQNDLLHSWDQYQKEKRILLTGLSAEVKHVEEDDVFGGTVNFAARIVGSINGAEIWLSDHAKEDIDRLGAAQHKRLR